MLGGAGDAAGDIEVAGELLPGHTHIAVKGQVFQRLRHGTGGADSRAGGLGQALHQLHVLLFADALTGGDHTLRLGDGRIHGDTHGEVVAVLFQCRHQIVDLLGGVALPEDGALADTGDGCGLLSR